MGHICANVLESYIENNSKIPWEDLRYIVGEIMYGGHITDAWDRRTNNAYLSVLLEPDMLKGKNLAPGFPVPPMDASFQDIEEYIGTKLPAETPQLFGLHPNAEIGYLTTTQQYVFSSILTLGVDKGNKGNNNNSGSSSSS